VKAWIVASVGIIGAGIGAALAAPESKAEPATPGQTAAGKTEGGGRAKGDDGMRLGAFSVSLAVKDIQKSREFYEKLGFTAVGGNQKQNWLIMRNDTTTIGLFQGMFDRNLLTFNPGWDAACNTLESFQDVREIQKVLKDRGLTLTTEADASTTGPASLTLVDPDGNPILLDQHVASPKKK